MKNPSCAICFCGYVPCMKWQQFLGLLMEAGAADFRVWRNTGIKFAGCGCTGGCARGPDGEAKKEDAVR